MVLMKSLISSSLISCRFIIYLAVILFISISPSKISVSNGEIGKYVDDVTKVTDVPNARKFIDDIADANSLDNFKGAAFEADIAAYYRQITSDMVIEPLGPSIDLKVGNKYIEMKSSFGSITESKFKNYISDTQDKFGKNIGTISGNPTKLEISAREGLGNLDANAIKNEINNE